MRKTREERLEEIHRCAAAVFLEKGYAHTTMEDIIERTTLSKGGFYHYYSDKLTVLMEIMRRGNFNFIDVHMTFDPSGTREDYCHWLTEAALIKVLDDRPHKKLFLMFLLEGLYNPELETFYLELEQEAIRCIYDKLPAKYRKGCHQKKLFFSRLLSGILMAQTFFTDKEILLKERAYLYDMFYGVMHDILEEKC